MSSSSSSCFLLLLLLVLAVLVVVESKPAQKQSYYAILGVDRTATQKQIRKKFFKLAKTLHPDKYKGKDKEANRDAYVILSKAHDVLSDPIKRERYDIGLHSGIVEYQDERWMKEDQERRAQQGAERDADPEKEWREHAEEQSRLMWAYYLEMAKWYSKLFLSLAIAVGFSYFSFVQFKKTRFYRKRESAQKAKAKKKQIAGGLGELQKQLKADEELRLLQEEVKKLEQKAIDADVAARAEEDGDEAPKIFLVCPSCKKKFKSVAQWDNHKKSKLHTKKMDQLEPARRAKVEKKLSQLVRVIEQYEADLHVWEMSQADYVEDEDIIESESEVSETLETEALEAEAEAEVQVEDESRAESEGVVEKDEDGTTNGVVASESESGEGERE
eukprot:TRINITY_DN439_c0_g2_i1.p1 TRINITY_DN439_c0_g2~~TRINITY_DN439_c0_g2_i1.p1  ORF type:complete len:403 (+),score=156.36 TRINITY_DN439_c0_g2_i1:51-1211(+)